MSNNTFNASLLVTPNFVARPGQANSSIITRLNTATRFVVTADDNNGRLEVQDPITVKNSINDVEPVRLTQLIDINTNGLVDRATLVYNAATEFFGFELFTNEFTDLEVSNTITVASLSANSSIGTAGQVLLSNGTTVYWGEQFVLPDELDGGLY